MTDAGSIEIVKAVGAILTPTLGVIAVVILQRLKWQQEDRDKRTAAEVAKVAVAAETAAKEVKQVKQTLEVTDARTTKDMAAIKQDTTEIRVHVNSQHLILLRSLADQSETIALLNPNETTRGKADEDRRVYMAHKLKEDEAAAATLALHKEHTGIAREQLEVQKKIEANTDPEKKETI